jgi:hypothetical protein
MTHLSLTLATLHPGAVVVVMQSRGCLARGEVLEVKADSKGDLWVPCLEGRHYLEHEANAGGELPHLDLVD